MKIVWIIFGDFSKCFFKLYLHHTLASILLKYGKMFWKGIFISPIFFNKMLIKTKMNLFYFNLFEEIESIKDCRQIIKILLTLIISVLFIYLL